MANNVFTGPNAIVAKAGANLTDILNSTNCAIIYEVGNPNKSWVPGRSINPITTAVSGKGYYLVMKQDADLSAVFIPPIPTGGGGGGGTTLEDLTLTVQPYGAITNVAGTWTGDGQAVAHLATDAKHIAANTDGAVYFTKKADTAWGYLIFTKSSPEVQAPSYTAPDYLTAMGIESGVLAVYVQGHDEISLGAAANNLISRMSRISGVYKLHTSPDGTTWTDVTPPTFAEITYQGNIYIHLDLKEVAGKMYNLKASGVV